MPQRADLSAVFEAIDGRRALRSAPADDDRAADARRRIRRKCGQTTSPVR
ncbi:hypothetical protein BRPE64_ACDS14120 [Caballeronia insecticola]|uniref:Uncharacterized protein n=1 Tax=Caballeronia insecticola TaxID=758793 RepID=R4WW26_9BURK|nr:hypothetical protein BRPE64_ACDS14120 [Caballeronia insecticola]